MEKLRLKRGLTATLVALALLCASPVAGHAEEPAPNAPKGEKPAEAEKGEPGKEKGKEGGEGAKEDKADKGVISGGRFAGDPVYFHLQPIVLPIINSEGAQQIIVLIIDLQVKDMESADTLRAERPRINDAVFRALYGALGEDSSRNSPLVDVSRIKDSIAAALEKTTGPHVVMDVLIQGMAQRML